MVLRGRLRSLREQGRHLYVTSCVSPLVESSRLPGLVMPCACPVRLTVDLIHLVPAALRWRGHRFSLQPLACLGLSSLRTQEKYDANKHTCKRISQHIPPFGCDCFHWHKSGAGIRRQRREPRYLGLRVALEFTETPAGNIYPCPVEIDSDSNPNTRSQWS